ncbi:transcriptional regulator, TetR family [Streptomyces sp. LamerLS-316]|uniref:TetR/AcrR family transcriptional regulator n=1 Tax=unclassified Streptomyces TaxID=2593676 RepID=UPI000823D398|nr:MULTISPECIES: TetR/AcrR family transcriptional regulator [unclassified Streptomyces]MYQ39656.1 TetR family transcriptional regulator [Streptomyces sp. SID4921]SCK25885.1 transcriptional regulator, TetR family [Streptomyces sp. LamerLS-316]
MRTVDPAKHQARRRHILDAATGLFAAKGYERTTTAEICKAAGISTGSLFHYFPNKRAIFLAVFDEEGDDKAEHLAKARSADDPWQALMDLVDHLATPATQPVVPALVMEAMVQAYRDPELEALLSRGNADEHAAIAELLTRAADDGLIDPELDPDSTATWITALIASVYTSAATSPGFDPADQLPTLRLILTRYLQAKPHSA